MYRDCGGGRVLIGRAQDEDQPPHKRLRREPVGSDEEEEEDDLEDDGPPAFLGESCSLRGGEEGADGFPSQRHRRRGSRIRTRTTCRTMMRIRTKIRKAVCVCILLECGESSRLVGIRGRGSRERRAGFEGSGCCWRVFQDCIARRLFEIYGSIRVLLPRRVSTSRSSDVAFIAAPPSQDDPRSQSDALIVRSQFSCSGLPLLRTAFVPSVACRATCPASPSSAHRSLPLRSQTHPEHQANPLLPTDLLPLPDRLPPNLMRPSGPQFIPSQNPISSFLADRRENAPLDISAPRFQQYLERLSHLSFNRCEPHHPLTP